ILDTFQEQPQSRIFEEAVSLAASFASTVQTSESLLDLMFVGTEAYCFSSGRGLAHADRMMEILACVQPCHDKPFADLLPMLFNHASLLSGCICILLSWDDERKKAVKTLQSLGVPLKVVIISEGKENNFDPGPMRGDPNNFHVLAAENMESGVAGL
ncbi:MAG: DUF58 domain-containing protein, partial [Candidatus Electrothrix sp. AR3]|nr:DUF58 domain-containing protein [Candidatus Electrothrix sp. AR3]